MIVGDMSDKIVSNKLYLLSTLLLCVFIYLLNFCTSIYQCATVFIIITTTFNILRALYGRLRSFGTLAAAVAISFVLLGKLPCYIDRDIVDNLVPSAPIRTLAPFITVAWLLYMLLDKLRSRLSPVMSNALMFIMKSITDGYLMVICFAMYGFEAFAIMIFIANIAQTTKDLDRDLKNGKLIHE